MILHCREARPTMDFRDIEGAGELPSGHVAGADVARLAGFHHVVQGLHGFFDWGSRVVAMNLVEIDMIDAQPAETVIDLGHDGAAGQALPIGPGSHPRPDFRRDDDFVACSKILQRRPTISSLVPSE